MPSQPDGGRRSFRWNPLDRLLDRSLRALLAEDEQRRDPAGSFTTLSGRSNRLRALRVLGSVFAGLLVSLSLCVYLALYPIPSGVDPLAQHELRLVNVTRGEGTIPSEGKNLVVVSAKADSLNFRIFDEKGKLVVDLDETAIKNRERDIDGLKRQLEPLWAVPHLARTSKESVIASVAALVDYRPVSNEVGAESVQPPHQPSRPETKEQLAERARREAMEGLGEEVGVAPAKLKELFAPIGRLLSAEEVAALRDDASLRAESERWLINLIGELKSRESTLEASVRVLDELGGVVESLSNKIDEDIRTGGELSSPALRDAWGKARRLAREDTSLDVFENNAGRPRMRTEVEIPRFDNTHIVEKARTRRPIKKSDIIRIIANCRLCVKTINEVDFTDGKFSAFLMALSPGLRGSLFPLSQRAEIEETWKRDHPPPLGMNDDPNTDDAFVLGARKYLGVYKYPPLTPTELCRGDSEFSRNAMRSLYRQYGVFFPYVWIKSDVNEAARFYETAARDLERLLGERTGTEATRLAEIRPRLLFPKTDASKSNHAVAKKRDDSRSEFIPELPIRAPGPGEPASIQGGASPNQDELREAQERVRDLERRHWIPAVLAAREEKVGAAKVQVKLEGLAGTWIVQGDRVVPGDGASPLRIIDKELIELLSFARLYDITGRPLAESIPSDMEKDIGLQGKEYRVLKYNGIVPGRWVLQLLQGAAASHRVQVLSIERLEREWPGDKAGQDQIARQSGFQVLQFGSKTAGKYDYSTRTEIIARLVAISEYNENIISNYWQRSWGQKFKLCGFGGDWEFDTVGRFRPVGPIIMNDKVIIEKVMYKYQVGNQLPLPGLRGTWTLTPRKTLVFNE